MNTYEKSMKNKSIQENLEDTNRKKTKKKNIITAIAILAFMVFLFVFTLYNVGVFDRQI